MDTALDVANQLFQQLELAGRRVVLAPTDRYYTRCEVDEREVPRQGYHHANLWSPQRPTFVYVGTVAIGLTLFETTEEIEVQYVNGKYIPVADLPVKSDDATPRSTRGPRNGTMQLDASVYRLSVPTA